MENFTPPALKPVLVTKITDDARAVRGTDVAQQQTLMTARAARDLLAGDIISISTPSNFDRKYLVKVDKPGQDQVTRVNLNYVTDASIRYLEANTYINGPSYAYDLDEYSVKRVQPGILHTYAQLPSGELTWDVRYLQSPKCITNPNAYTDDSTSAHRGDTVKRHPTVGSVIRQLFYARNTSVEDNNSYTRTGVYKGYDEENDVELYDWGSWGWVSGREMYIIVTDDTVEEVTNPVVNAIYSVHTSISEFALPNAKELTEGASITIIQYPDPNSNDPAAWASLITYTDPDDPSNIMRTLATPAPVRNTTKNKDGYLEELAPTEYRFVVIPVIDPVTKNQTGRTWELQIDADETDFTAGISEMLAAHTDPGVNDIVDYAARRYKEDDGTSSQSNKDVLAITRAMPTAGYVEGVIRKEGDSLNDMWSFSVQRLVVTGTDNPNFTEVTESYPDENTLYFVRRTELYDKEYKVTYQLALDPDYPDLEPGYLKSKRPTGDNGFPATESQYYRLVDNAQLIREDIFAITGNRLTVGKEVRFKHYFNRHDLLYVAITPSNIQTHSVARKYVNVKVGIVPDPHPGVYIPYGAINQSSYTYEQLAHDAKTGSIADYVDGAYGKMPISTAAVMAAYDDITGRIQKRGLMTGIVNTGSTDASQLDDIRQTGFYYLIPTTPGTSATANGGYPVNVTAGVPAHLIVSGGETATSSMRTADDQYFRTEDEEPNNEKTYYIWDATYDSYVEAIAKGSYASFQDDLKPYYEKSDIGYELNGADVVQILIQFGNVKNIWFRKFSQNTKTWSVWTSLAKEQYVTHMSMKDGDHMDAAEVSNALTYGNPNINIDLTYDAEVDIYLPNKHTEGTEMTFSITGGKSVKFRYTDAFGSNRIYSVYGITKNYDAVIVKITNNGTYWMFTRTDVSFGAAQ